MKISRQAVGDRSAAPSQITYSAPGRQTHDKHIEGLPLGTRGGLLVNHLFPLDAEYEFAVGGAGPGGGGGGSALDVTLDGEPIPVRNPRGFRQRVSAGPHSIGLALVDRQRGAGVDEGFSDFRVDSAFSPAGGVQTVTITGPFDPTGTGTTPSQKKVFVCRPAAAAEETPCARRIVSALARRAFRQPPSRGRRRNAHGLLPRRARGRHLRHRYPARARSHPGRAEVRLPHRTGVAGTGPHLRDQRPRARLAVVVLPVELDSRRSAARPRRARPPVQPDRARAAGRADAQGPEVRRADQELLRPVAVLA